MITKADIDESILKARSVEVMVRADMFKLRYRSLRYGISRIVRGDKSVEINYQTNYTWWQLCTKFKFRDVSMVGRRIDISV